MRKKHPQSSHWSQKPGHVVARVHAGISGTINGEAFSRFFTSIRRAKRFMRTGKEDRS